MELILLVIMSTLSTAFIQQGLTNSPRFLSNLEHTLERKLLSHVKMEDLKNKEELPKVWMGLGPVQVDVLWDPVSGASGYSLALEESRMHWTLLQGQKSYSLPGLRPDRTYTAVVTPLAMLQSIPPPYNTELKLHFTTPALLSERGNIYDMIEENSLKKCLDGVQIKSVSLSVKLEGLSTRGMVLETVDLSSATPIQWVDLPANSSVAYLTGLRPESFIQLTLKQIQSLKPLVFKEILTKKVFTGGCRPPPNTNLTRTLLDLFFPTKTSGSRWSVRCYADDEVFTGYPCHNSDICIPKNWMCDNDDDCPGGDDEHHCGSSHYHNSFCSKTEFRCVRRREHVCLPISWLCDGRQDCTDGWDEDPRNCRGYYGKPGGLSYQYQGGCRQSYFRCHNHLGCVAHSFICDGEHDCADGSDEWDCGSKYEFNCDSFKEFQCFDSPGKDSCIPRSWMCDDNEDCAHGEDEDIDICRRIL